MNYSLKYVLIPIPPVASLKEVEVEMSIGGSSKEGEKTVGLEKKEKNSEKTEEEKSVIAQKMVTHQFLFAKRLEKPSKQGKKI